MDERTASAADAEPPPEPRGPHLPDSLTRIPFIVWPFAVLTAWVAYVQWGGIGSTAFPSQLDALSAAASAVPHILAPLIGVAFFLRHPDAPRLMPMLAFGVVLLAGHRVLVLLTPVVAPVLQDLSPANPQEPPFESLLLFGYRLLTALVETFAILYVARGLGSARRFIDLRGARFVVAAAVLAAVSLPAVNAWNFVQQSGQFPEQAPYVTVSILAGLASLLAWAYLAATAVNGRRAGEDPASGWTLAAVAGGSMLLATLALAAVSAAVLVAGTVEPGSALYDAYFALYRVYSFVVAAVWLALLAAFALGLPAEVGESEELDDWDEPAEAGERAEGSAVDDEPATAEPEPVA